MIELQSIDITYGKTKVISDLSITVERGEFFTLLGSSGCGKTTLLRSIAGFVMPSAGQINVDGKDVTKLGPEERGIGIVFQSYALFPTMTVFENVAFGLRVAKKSKSEIKSLVEDALEKIGITEHAQKRPSELSGGQQQRVAIARALVLGTEVLLFDEPLSNLDAKMRETMRDEIRGLQQRLGLTVVYVTHDQQEALAISDRIAVVSKGQIDQLASPRDIYHEPATEYVFKFIGESSQLPKSLVNRLGVPDLIARLETGPVYTRPEEVVLGKKTDEGWLTFEATLKREEFRGNVVRLVLSVDDADIFCDVDGRYFAGQVGENLSVSVRSEHVYSFGGTN